MDLQFTAHNIRLDNGRQTKPDAPLTMDRHPRFLSARRLLDTLFPGDKQPLRLIELGCLEGGYAVEFARLGFQVLGLEVRESDIAACNFVKTHTNLPNLRFVRDDALNVARHGPFDVAFCCGLLYHFDKPRQFLTDLSSVTRRLLILDTHYATDHAPEATQAGHYRLSPLEENEGLAGRWFTEFGDEASFQQREQAKWSSWDNRRSFWGQREHLLQAVHDAGFDMVMEQYDTLAPGIAPALLQTSQRVNGRGTFIGVKTR